MKAKLCLLMLLASFTTFGFSETISEIQGTTSISSFNEKNVKSVKGIVTGIRKTKYNNGFFMQSKESDGNLNTSEGIYVENKTDISVSVGDLVEVDGMVKEIYLSSPDKMQPTITSIYASNLVILENNLSIMPLEIDGKNIPRKVHNGNLSKLDRDVNAMDYYESLEGMLVKIKDPLITGFKEKYGDITVVPSYGKYTELRSINGGVVYNNYEFEQSQRITITATPWNIVKKSEYINNLSPNPGDKLKGDVEGVVIYEHGEYRLYPTSSFPGIEDGSTKPDTNEFKYDKKKLNVVSYNIENFTIADGPARVKELARQVKTVLQTPDILGLIEVGDDDGGNIKTPLTSAKKTIEAIIDEIKKETGISYGYMSVDPLDLKDGGWPEMHIRNVILYRKDRLTPVKFNQGDAITDTKVISKKGKVSLTFNPGRIGNNDPIWDEVRKPVIAQFKFMNKNIFVLANHLKSKRSDAKIYGTVQPVERKSELVRNPQGTYINNFVKDILKADKKATVIVLGDMNDFEFSNTIKNINGNELIDVISTLPKNERYTYVYQGNSQTLDNIMINKKYKGSVNVDVIRINSEFTKAQGSFSDHDPIFIQFKVK